MLEGPDAIGSVDLSLIEDGAAELGFLFRRDRWGLGFASEAAAAVIAHAIGAAGPETAGVRHTDRQPGGSRVLEKNGFA